MEDEFAAAGGRVDRLLQAAEADLPGLEGGDRLDEVLERASQAIELPDGEGIPRAEEGEGFRQATALILGPAGHVGEDSLAAGVGEGVALEVEALILGGDTRVADEHATLRCGPHGRSVSELSGPVKFRDLDFETGNEAGMRASSDYFRGKSPTASKTRVFGRL